MIGTGTGASIYFISINGFDTHAQQQDTHPLLLKQLSDALSAFQLDLEERALANNVLTMAYSEFGRRVADNERCGTDHGGAAPILLLGSSVKGGLYGDYPSLTDLEGGGIKHQMDFRTIYATIIDRWFAADSRSVLGCNFDHLPVV